MAAAVFLVLAGAYAGLVLGVVRSADVIQARPFTPEAKRALVGELEAAWTERRRHGNTPVAIAHAQRALALASRHGQTRVAVYLRIAFHAGCGAAQSLYGLSRALELAREASTVPAPATPLLAKSRIMLL